MCLFFRGVLLSLCFGQPTFDVLPSRGSCVPRGWLPTNKPGVKVIGAASVGVWHSWLVIFIQRTLLSLLVLLLLLSLVVIVAMVRCVYVRVCCCCCCRGSRSVAAAAVVSDAIVLGFSPEFLFFIFFRSVAATTRYFRYKKELLRFQRKQKPPRHPPGNEVRRSGPSICESPPFFSRRTVSSSLI